jgi:hypothetical protein
LRAVTACAVFTCVVKVGEINASKKLQAKGTGE